MTTNLQTKYLGLTLANPLVASASPLTGTIDRLKQLEDAGVSAVVLPSLFEEEIEHDELQLNQLYELQSESFAESLSYFPELDFQGVGPEASLERITDAKKHLSIPVIASLNGHSDGGWTRYAKGMQEAGADAIELNIYFVPTDCDTTSNEVEQRYIDLVESIRSTVTIPLCVKIGSQFSSIPSMAQRFMTAGADGLVLFNRYLEPDIDLDTLTIHPDLVLSAEHEMRLPLRWIAILRDQLPISLAATGGIHQSYDIAKLLMVGADVAMVATTLLRRGPSYAATMLEELEAWLNENDFASVEQMKGSLSLANCPDPSALERANYMRAMSDFIADFE